VPPSKKVSRKLIGEMMAAWRDCRPLDFKSLVPSEVFYSEKGTQFCLGAPWKERFKKIAESVDRCLDQYPLSDFERFLQTVVANAEETAASEADTSVFFRDKLADFFVQITSAPEWELVTGITGFTRAQPPFSVGPSRFFVMDQTEFDLWARRRSCDHNEPPSGTVPRLDRLGEIGSHLLGNWVASLRVRAIDASHATAKAGYRLEASLNVVRHGAFRGGPRAYVRAAVLAAGYWDWLRIGMALHAVAADGTMLEAWDRRSQNCPDKYQPGACERKWKSFGGCGGLGIGTLIHLARENGWQYPRSQRAVPSGTPADATTLARLDEALRGGAEGLFRDAELLGALARLAESDPVRARPADRSSPHWSPGLGFGSEWSAARGCRSHRPARVRVLAGGPCLDQYPGRCSLRMETRSITASAANCSARRSHSPSTDLRSSIF
jgi:Primase C terminal 2 (PriCT-2)